jgi:superoxide dismutase, Fe-Mn family
MELHHSKHHQTYVTNLNIALGSLYTAVSAVDGPAQLKLVPAVRFNGGGHINHSLFWKNLCPASSPDSKPSAAPALTEAIQKTWGDEQAFRESFKKILLGIQGSGWGWLIKVPGTLGSPDRLRIVTTKDQDPVLGDRQIPIIGIDMWEHAYYLQVRESFISCHRLD